FRKAADTDAMDLPGKRSGPFHPGAERAHGFGGVEDVFALEQARNPGFPHRQRAQDQRPMRDRLVPGHANLAGKGTAGAGLKGAGGAGMGQVWVLSGGQVTHAPEGVTVPKIACKALLTAASQLAK